PRRLDRAVVADRGAVRDLLAVVVGSVGAKDIDADGAAGVHRPRADEILRERLSTVGGPAARAQAVEQANEARVVGGAEEVAAAPDHGHALRSGRENHHHQREDVPLPALLHLGAICIEGPAGGAGAALDLVVVLVRAGVALLPAGEELAEDGLGIGLEAPLRWARREDAVGARGLAARRLRLEGDAAGVALDGVAGRRVEVDLDL